MSAIHDLIAQVNDPRLRQRLTAEWAHAAKQKKFGLVFEDHLPELLPLHSAKPHKGDLVCRRNGPLKDVWQVKSVHAGMATCIKPSNQTRPSEPNRAAAEPELIAVNELLVVREFGEPIFPALVPVDAVANGPADAPWHTLIEADNYHALQLLDYLYAGQVDCIYIDPPYNTGARDWKYNNDYVDSNDSWRHSKWLAFMEKRLKLAQRLLKPDGVLIITIDEHEVNNLALLLRQTLVNARDIQMVTIVTNTAGSLSPGKFSRAEEYAFFCFYGTACPAPMRSDLLSEAKSLSQYWFPLFRSRGLNDRPSRRPNLVYPIAIDTEALKVAGTGQTLAERVAAGLISVDLDEWLPKSNEKINGFPVVWPVLDSGELSTWQVTPNTLMKLQSEGYIRVRKINSGDSRRAYSIQYVKTGNRMKIESGEIQVSGQEPSGALILQGGERTSVPKSTWKVASHDARQYGTTMLRDILGVTSFTYPKSPYATADALRTVLRNKKNGLILDFFAGSGTTLQSTLMLNQEDEGTRRCILVTNNEVATHVAAALAERKLQHGDEEWEAQGICRSVTWPRSKYTILGRRDDGTVLTGEYLTGKTTEREKSRSFTHIGFVHPSTLNTQPKKKQMVALIDGLPQTLVQGDSAFIVSEDHKASVLFDSGAAEAWLEALDGQTHISDFYIVTPSTREFQALKSQVVDLLGPLLVPEEERRPMSEGFAANLAYFKLDFLEKDSIPLRRAFKELLPLLWLKAGAVGPRPSLKRHEPEPHFLAPEGNNFAVLLEESRLRALLKHLTGRTGLAQVYIVTDSDEAFKSMAREVRATLLKHSPDVQVAQLYRDYLLNFMINTHLDRTADTKDVGSAHP
jgi:adenine-specific DNA-methyltransferase